LVFVGKNADADEFLLQQAEGQMLSGLVRGGSNTKRRKDWREDVHEWLRVASQGGLGPEVAKVLLGR